MITTVLLWCSGASNQAHAKATRGERQLDPRQRQRLSTELGGGAFGRRR